MNTFTLSKQITIIILVLTTCLSASAQVNLLPIDSLYMNSLKSFYQNAQNSKDEIWDGMTLAPVCLFRINGPAFLYNHPKPPGSFSKISENLYVGSQKELGLFGATQIKINDILTAITDYGNDNYLSPDEALAELFHELHHAYQLNDIKGLQFDDPVILISYPENYKNDAIKLFEQNILYKMCFASGENEFRQLLNQFYSCRKKRGRIINEYLDYEKNVENVEGPAFYCQLQFFKKFAECSPALKNNYIQKNIFGILTNPYYGRNSLRMRHLASGCAMCVILDRYYSAWKKEYYDSGENLYDFFISKFTHKSVPLPAMDIFHASAKFHVSNEIAKHKTHFEKFNSSPGIKVKLKFASNPRVTGFDPMNAESINDSIILHITLLRLINNENKLFITNKEVISFIREKIWNIEEVLFFIEDRSQLKNDKEYIIISAPGMEFKWKGKIKSGPDDMIVIECE